MNFTETVLEDEFPIIRFAKTEQDDTVIVLTVDNDDETSAFHYLHVPVNSKQEHEYRESKITLREIVLSAPWLNLVETDENDEPVKVYQYSPAEFPKKYLPLEGSYIPKSYLRVLEQIANAPMTIKDKTFRLTFRIIEVVLKSLKQKGIHNYETYLSEKMSTPRPNISRMLNCDGNITIKTLLKALDAADLEMEVKFYTKDTLKPIDHISVATVRIPDPSDSL